jgi:two-component system cell cycle response regulator
LRILIADDEAVSWRLLEKILSRAGYEVSVVENGKLAVEQLRLLDGPRLALLDWVMPELDGPAVAGKSENCMTGLTSILCCLPPRKRKKT